jgi:hypothetical protein
MVNLIPYMKKASVFLFVFTFVSSIAGKMYHSFAFLPSYYGSFKSSFKVLFSFEHGIAYLRDPVGITFLVLIIASIILSFVLLLLSIKLDGTRFEKEAKKTLRKHSKKT